MAKNQIVIVIDIKMALWLKLYLYALVTFCKMFRTEPDYAKLDKIITKGLIANVNNKAMETTRPSRHR